MGAGCCSTDSTSVQGPKNTGNIKASIKTIEIEYFDAQGRGNQLRMLSWYGGLQYKDTRRTFEEFLQRKKAGLVKFDTVPNIYLEDGTQLGQTQSMMRWIAQNQTGKKGEKLYPGKSNPEASYQIDELLEISESYLRKFFPHSKPNCTIDQVKEIATTHWISLL